MVLWILFLAHPIVSFLDKKVENIFVLDLSYSMLADDVWSSRLALAKKIINQLSPDAQKTPLVVFAWKVEAPVMLEAIDIPYLVSFNQVKSGTATGDALLVASKMPGKNIILITDGAVNRGKDIIETLRYIKQKALPVFTIGVAWTSDVMVKIPTQMGREVNKMVWGIDSQTLQKIAIETKGKFFHVQDISESKKVEIAIKKAQEMTKWKNSIQKYLASLFFVFFLITGCLYFYIFTKTLWK